jgi:hypothetical protein
MAYPQNINKAADYACVIFIFFFSFGYSIGFGPNAWVYGTEVRPSVSVNRDPLISIQQVLT